MSKSRPVVVHPEEGMPEPPGAERRHFFDPDNRWVGWASWIRNEAGDVSGWHHHAANETYVYVIRGSVTVDFGAGGAESIVARAGTSSSFRPTRSTAKRLARIPTSRHLSSASAASRSTSKLVARNRHEVESAN
jgi:hypothetical protein